MADELTWQRERPTGTGWYWWRRCDDDDPRIVRYLDGRFLEFVRDGMTAVPILPVRALGSLEDFQKKRDARTEMIAGAGLEPKRWVFGRDDHLAGGEWAGPIAPPA